MSSIKLIDGMDTTKKEEFKTKTEVEYRNNEMINKTFIFLNGSWVNDTMVIIRKNKKGFVVKFQLYRWNILKNAYEGIEYRTWNIVDEDNTSTIYYKWENNDWVYDKRVDNFHEEFNYKMLEGVANKYKEVTSVYDYKINDWVVTRIEHVMYHGNEMNRYIQSILDSSELLERYRYDEKKNDYVIYYRMKNRKFADKNISEWFYDKSFRGILKPVSRIEEMKDEHGKTQSTLYKSFDEAGNIKELVKKEHTYANNEEATLEYTKDSLTSDWNLNNIVVSVYDDKGVVQSKEKFNYNK